MKSICIVGTGGFAKEVLSLINDLGWYDDVEAFMEPDHLWEKRGKDKIIMGKKVLPMSIADPDKHRIVIGVADSVIRQKTLRQLSVSIEFMTLIHPSVNVSKWVKVGKGSIIASGCILTCDIELGEFSQLNLNTTIGHDNIIGDFFTTAPAVNISGECHIGSHVYFGNGSATKQGVNICNDVVIGMGAMVVKDITEPGTYIGIPARKLVKEDNV